MLVTCHQHVMKCLSSREISKKTCLCPTHKKRRKAYVGYQRMTRRKKSCNFFLAFFYFLVHFWALRSETSAYCMNKKEKCMPVSRYFIALKFCTFRCVADMSMTCQKCLSCWCLIQHCTWRYSQLSYKGLVYLCQQLEDTS